ncbi:MAG: ribosomal protein modification protein [Alphaproteobacteria bacterium]|nr:ribosomal protein modification protein [Alphaproteobacteria bacterium]
MKIALLATDPELYSHKRLMEEGTKRGHEMIFLKAHNCYMAVTEKTPSIHYRGGYIIEEVDAVIPRLRPSQTFYGLAVLRHFELMGAYSLNGSIPISRARDKLRAMQLLARKGIALPKTGFANSPADSKDLIQMVGGAPLIIKLLDGTQGAGVVLADTNKAAESVIDAFKTLNANFLVQEFIKEAGGKDLRCFVIGNKVYAAMERSAAGGEFRSNIHRGGTAQMVEITPEEKHIALEATKVMGLSVAGVDIIRSKSGPKVLEVNASPGLEGIEGSTGKNIAGQIISYIEKQASKNQPGLFNNIIRAINPSTPEG